MTERAKSKPPESHGERVERLLAAYHDEGQAAPHLVDWRMLRELWPFARPQLALFVLAFVMMPLIAAATVYQPHLLQRAVDAVGGGRNDDVLTQVTLEFAAVIAVRFVLQFVETYTMQLAGQRTVARLRVEVFAHLQRLSVRFFDRTPVGRLVTRVTNDMDALVELFASGAVTALGDVLLLVGIVVAMLITDWRLSLIAFSVLPPMVLCIELLRRVLRRAYRVIRNRIAQLNALMNEQVQGVHVVAAFGQEALCAEAYAEVNGSYRDAYFMQIRYDALLYSVVDAVSSICVGLALWYAAQRIGLMQDPAAAEAYKGTFVALYAYIHQFFVPVRDLSTKYTAIQSSFASAEKIFGLLGTHDFDAPVSGAEPSGPTAAERESSAVAIEFRDVDFRYQADAPVLSDVSFEVQRGSTVAIVGATGAGKSTVAALAQRFFEVDAGEVRVFGTDVCAYPREDLRRQFAVVQQDVFLFAGDVLHNVALGEETPDRERAKLALSRVGAWPLLAERGGLDTIVQERGANLSLGERQLIAFARALYRDPPILILDEATANIDSETEARLQRAVDVVLEGRTAVVIAHRLSTIRRADTILVFHHGRLVEQGSHPQLVERGGVYARLVHLQLVGGDPG